MIYRLRNDNYGIFEEAHSIPSDDDIESIIGEDFFWDIVQEAIDSVEVEPAGVFNEDDLMDKIYSCAEKYINDKENEIALTVEEISEDEGIISSTKISTLERVLFYLDEDKHDCNSSNRVASYIEESLQAFVKKSKWHIEFLNMNDSGCSEKSQGINTNNNPIIWYGLDEKGPCLPWIITSEDDNLSFWFEEDSWSFLDSISDLSESTLIWYTGECEYWTPDMEEIRRTCPIHFTESDNGEDVIRKVKRYLAVN